MRGGASFPLPPDNFSIFVRLSPPAAVRDYSRMKFTLAPLLLALALSLAGVSRADLAETLPADHAWRFEVLRHYPGTINECHPTVDLTGLAVNPSGTTAAGWYERGCGLPNSAADTGLVTAIRDAADPWTFIRQTDALCGFSNCRALHGVPALALNADGHAFNVFSGPGPSDTYHVYVQDMVSGMPATRRMPVAASQSSQSHLNISATVLPGDALPTFAWSAITGFGGPLMLGLPEGQVTIDASVAVWYVDSFQRHVVAHANDAAGPGVYYSPGDAGVLRSVLPTTYNEGVSIAVGADGRIHLAVSGGPTGTGTHDGRLVYLRSDDGGVSWDRADLDLTNTRHPSIALDSAGVPAIVYARSQSLRFARLSGGTWTNALFADLPEGHTTPPHLAFDVDDRAQVLFYNRSTRDIMLATGLGVSSAPRLTASIAGNGGGTVTSAPEGISCGADCEEVFAPGRYVLLTAEPDDVSEFAGWAGACTGVGACLVRMDEAKNVAASFVRLDDQPAIEVAPPGSGGCTLPDAIHAANADKPVGACTAGSGADVIHVPAGVYTLTTVDNTTFGLLTGLPIVTSNITIVGDGAESTIIERAAGSPEFRLFRVWHVSSQLSLRGLTVKGGHGSASGGGGVYANGPLSVRSCIFTGNDAGAHGGGAIRWSGHKLTIAGSRFSNNRASKYLGGALHGTGSPAALLSITGSTFDGNSAIIGGAISYAASGDQGRGGLIANSTLAGNTALQTGGALEATGVTLFNVVATGNTVTAPGSGGGGAWVNNTTIIDSTLTDNSVAGAGSGGGLLGDGRVTVIQSTISNNRAFHGGGAQFGGETDLANVTVSGNVSRSSAGGIAHGSGALTLRNVTVTANQAANGHGGGVRSVSFAMIALQNTIVAGNVSSMGSSDCQSSGHPLRSLGSNLIGSITGCTYIPAAGDVTGTAAAPIDARLGALGDNGGLTLTHAPAANSPASDAGSPLAPGSAPAACETTDQRGEIRPQGAACDIGAVERKESAPADTTPPMVTFAVAPEANAAGWHNSPVTVTWTTTDDVGVVASTRCDVVIVSADTAGTTLTCEATDAAGNTGRASVIVKLDRVAPTIAAARTPAANEYGWNNTDVTVAFTCADGLSGVVFCSPAAVVTAEGGHQSRIGTVIDQAGNDSSVTVTGIHIDRTPPTVSISSPVDGAELDTEQSLTVAFRADDELSGIASQTATLDGTPVPNGAAIDLASSAGVRTLRVEGRDRAGSASAAAVTFTVVRAIALDIKPSSCPNPIGTRDRGMLPVAIAGLPGFDVRDIDPASIRLEGVAPVRWAFEDAATPYGPPYLAKQNALDCTTLGGDGTIDLTLKFDVQSIVQALGAATGFEVRRLKLTGRLKADRGGTPFVGVDVVRIQTR